LDGYYEDVGKTEDMSSVEDIQKRLDRLSKARGARDWTDLVTRVAQQNPEGFRELCDEMTEYTKKKGEEFSERLKKKFEEKAAREEEEKKKKEEEKEREKEKEEGGEGR
jgi:hypothetical protein